MTTIAPFMCKHTRIEATILAETRQEWDGDLSASPAWAENTGHFFGTERPIQYLYRAWCHDCNSDVTLLFAEVTDLPRWGE